MNILGMLELMKQLLDQGKKQVEPVLVDILPIIHHIKDENK